MVDDKLKAIIYTFIERNHSNIMNSSMEINRAVDLELRNVFGDVADGIIYDYILDKQFEKFNKRLGKDDETILRRH